MSEARPPDPDEATSPREGGDLPFRARTRPLWFYNLIFVLPAMLSLSIALLSEPISLFPLFSALVALALWALFYELQITVSREEVQIRFGIFGPNIPLRAIERCEAVEYSWVEFGGWGIKRSIYDNTWAFNLPGDQGRALKITWRDPEGRTRRTLVSSEAPALLASVIEGARREAGEHASRPSDLVLDLPRGQNDQEL